VLSHRAESHGIGRHGLGQTVSEWSEAPHHASRILGELSLPQRAIQHVEHMGVNDRSHRFHEVTRERRSAYRVGMQNAN
jgi:hypothetical protein